MNNKKLFNMDKQGNLEFTVDKRLHKEKFAAESLWHQTWLLVLIMVACGVMDYFCFEQLFSSVLYDSPLLRGCCVIAMLCAYEIAPVYLAYNLKKRACGYKVNMLSIIIPLAVFLLAVAANLYLRLVTATDAFPDLSNLSTSVIGNSVVAQTSGSTHAHQLGLFFGILPILTALTCFAAAYTMSNPLKKALQKLAKQHHELSKSIDQLKSILSEYDSEENYLNRLLANDETKYRAALAKIHSQRKHYYDYCRHKIGAHLGSASAISYRVDYDTDANKD